MRPDVVAEVERQHRLLASWLGTSAQPDVLEALDVAHTSDFSMVTADGRSVGRQALLAALAGASNARPSLRILIGAVREVADLGEALLVEFLETHVEHGHTSARRVTALLQIAEDAPNGLRWRHVHETPVAE